MTPDTQIIIAILGSAFVQVVVFAVGWGKMQQKIRDLDNEVQFIKDRVFKHV